MSKSTELSKKFIYLPASNLEMEKFLDSNKDIIYLYITNKIYDAILAGEDCVEVFGFKGTEYCVLIHKTSFYKILDKYFNFFIQNEMYESCAEVNKAKSALDRYNELVKQNII